MKNLITLILILVFLPGCNFSKSVKKDLISGLVTLGDGLSCENVYLSVNNVETSATSFVYGTKFKMNFSDLAGFRKEGEVVFPGMNLYVTAQAGDTVFKTGDLCAEYTSGISLSPLLLSAAVTAADPIHSGSDYTLHVNIWDKKDKGKYSGKVNFRVVPNEQLVIEPSGIKIREAYLFSQERNEVITSNRIRSKEHTYVIIEGLEGLSVSEGLVYPGLAVTLTDAQGNKILEEKDLFSDYTGTGMPSSDLTSGVSYNFILSGGEVKNPLNLVLNIWDKKSTAKIAISASLIAE
jgi:hypothetical protein